MELKGLKVLVVSNFFPYPPNFGGVYDIFGRIVDLKSLGCDIDLVYTDKKYPLQKDIDHLGQFVDKMFFVQRQNNPVKLLSSKPLQVTSRSGLMSVDLENREYDLLILEGDYVGEILENTTLKVNKKILRVHNDETIYFHNLCKSTKNIIEKLYFKTEEYKFSNYAPALQKAVDRLWFISHDELEKNTLNKGIHLPTPINLDEFIYDNTLESQKVLFVGSLFMPNNIAAINWYLEFVHDHINKHCPNYNLVIAGSTGSLDETIILKKFEGYKNVEVLCNVEDLDELYNECSIFINPMQHGAGVKIKSIHAMMKGLPLIASKVGSEGIGLKANEHFYLGDSPQTFVDSIVSLLKSPEERNRLMKNGQTFLKENNSINKLRNELEGLFSRV